MKTPFPFSGSCGGLSPTSNGGFTLPEILITGTVFTMLVGSVLIANVFGLRMFRITETKLIATDAARKATGKITGEIQTCKTTYIGNVSNGFFLAKLDGETQAGSGLLIYPTTNKANFIIYFVNPEDKTFRRTTSKSNSATILAQFVTNTMVFRAQDYSGKLLTNNQNNRVIHLNLEFYQPKGYLQVADCYKLETSVTRRAVE